MQGNLKINLIAVERILSTILTISFIQGLYRGAKNNEMRLGRCSRSNDVVEPLIKPQWFVNCGTMAKEALDAAMDSENRKLEFVPKQYTAEWRRCSLVFLLRFMLDAVTEY